MASQPVVSSEFSEGDSERTLALLQHSFDVIALVDNSGTVQYVSPSIDRVLGYSQQEFIGRNGFEQVHPDDVAEVRRLFNVVLQQPGEFMQIDARALHKDGTWRWLESRVTNLLDNPSVGALVVNFRDITDRKEFERRLEEQQEYWRIAVTSIGDAVIITNPEGHVTFMNPVAGSLCGWSPSEAIGKPLREVFHIVNERTRVQVESPVEKVIAHGRTVGLANHTVLVARDGRETAIDDSAAPILNDEGCIAGVVLVFRDVQERRHAEQWRQYLAAIVESSDDIIVSKTLEGIITSWNRGAERTLGYKADEVIGKHISMLIPPEHAEDTEKILSRIRRGEKVDHYQSKRRCKDGQIIDVSLTVSPIRNEEGEIIGASKVARDITSQKMLEREREESNQRKDEFLAMLAHELRNPLAAIHGASLVLGRSNAPSELGWANDVIQRQVKHLSRLIDDLLDVSRITRGKIALRKTLVDLAPIVTSALENVRPLIEDRKHEVSVSLAAGELRLEADPLRLEQILINLLTNAAKYTNAGGRISLMAARDENDIVVTVKDTGSGIARDMLPRIFDLFAQGDRTIDRAEGGLGIGLTIVKRLVELHDGTITASSEGPGKGAEFTIRLPSPVTARQPDSELTRPLPPVTGSQGHVLVVDDNHDMASGLAKLLTVLGYEVETAYDGKTAIELATQLRPKAVLLDLGLPGMSGYEVVARLRRDEACRGTVFIAITGYGQDEDIRKSKAAGFDHHMVKPIDHHALLTVLADAN